MYIALLREASIYGKLKGKVIISVVIKLGGDIGIEKERRKK